MVFWNLILSSMTYLRCKRIIKMTLTWSTSSSTLQRFWLFSTSALRGRRGGNLVGDLPFDAHHYHHDKSMSIGRLEFWS